MSELLARIDYLEREVAKLKKEKPTTSTVYHFYEADPKLRGNYIKKSPSIIYEDFGVKNCSIGRYI